MFRTLGAAVALRAMRRCGARSAVARLLRAWLLSPRERVSRPRSLRAACVTKLPRGGRFVTHAMRTLFPRCPNHAEHTPNARTERTRSSAQAEQRPQELQLVLRCADEGVHERLRGRQPVRGLLE